MLGHPPMAIQFGTDGWRAVIGEEYTFENVRKVIQAFCDVKAGSSNRLVVLGYDRRFASRLFAEAAGEILLGNGFQVLFSQDFCPTPCISWMTKKKGALAGVVITASHNPYQWNGVKFKEEDGGSASPEYTSQIETRLQQNDKQSQALKRITLQEGKEKGLLNYYNPKGEYVRQLKRMVDVGAIRRAKLKIIADSMHGAGSGYFKEVLGSGILEIHGEENPSFGGVNPEPIEKNLREARAAILKTRSHVVLATDGDADRIGAIDEKGQFVTSHQIFSLILRHLVSVKKKTGDVIKTVSTTEMIERLGKKYNFPVIETPIGFKHICDQFRHTRSLMGGEESGGIAFTQHVNERDGILSGLLLLEVMAHYKKPLSHIIAGLQKEVGPLHFIREDFHLSPTVIQDLRNRLNQEESLQFPKFHLKNIGKRDGFKYYFADGSWLLIRPSGTEPLLRIYAESTSPQKTRSLIQAGKKLAGIK
jgi:phosphomannomutase